MDLSNPLLQLFHFRCKLLIRDKPAVDKLTDYGENKDTKIAKSEAPVLPLLLPGSLIIRQSNSLDIMPVVEKTCHYKEHRFEGLEK